MNSESSLKKQFLKYVAPAVISQWVYMFYIIVDGIFVGRGVSGAGLTAINILSPFTIGMFAVSLLMAEGAAAIVAIRLGEGNVEEANKVFTQNIVMNIILSVILTAAVYIWMEPFCRFLGATDYNIYYVMEYLKGLTPFVFSFILSYSFEMLVKTDGYPQTAVIATTAGSFLNIFLDYIMIIVWKMGLFGAAFATGISNTVVIIVYLIHFARKKGVLRYVKFRWSNETMFRQLKNGLSSGITEFSAGLIVLVFNWAILKYLFEDALISYTIITDINCVAVMTMAGIAQGYQPLIGYYFGAKEYGKCRKVFRYGLVSVLVMSILLTGVSVLFAAPISCLFLEEFDPELLSFTVHAFRIFALSFMVLGYNIVISAFFMSIEKAFESSLISFARGIGIIIFSLTVMSMLFGGEGIWWSPLVSEALSLLLTIFLFVRYKNSGAEIFS